MSYDILNEKQLQEIDTIYSKWLISNRKLEYLEQIHDFLISVDFSSVINAFTKRLESVPYSFTKSEKVSGSICFYGAVFTSLLNTGKIEEIEGLFTFALCYMLIDHFLDDINNSDESKEKIMKEVYNFILYGKDSPNNPLISAAKERYLQLIARNPKVKNSLLNLLKSELKGSTVSNNVNLSREEYKNIAIEKGGGTSSSIATIIGINHDVKSPHYICGSLIQFVDDLLDIKDDSRLKIYTLARRDLDHGGLDFYVYETVLEIEKLDCVYNFFKPVLMMGVILGIHDNPGSISENLDKILKKYDPFDEETSKDSLNNWFHDKLFNYLENEKNDIKIKM